MTRSFIEDAEHEGFAQGWFDGLHHQPAIPKPALSVGMFDLEYLQHFKAAYQDGHETARQDLKRRNNLLEIRRNKTHHTLERDDV